MSRQNCGHNIYIHRASKCKLLGSLLDTEKYINRRTTRGIDAFKTLNANFDNRQISNTAKMRTFDAYFASVFPYKSELKTPTKKLLGHLKRLHPDLQPDWHSTTNVASNGIVSQNYMLSHLAGTFIAGVTV